MTDPPGTNNTLSVLLTSTSSDAHSWNLVVLELALGELGANVRNLGPCAPEELVVDAARLQRPGLIVVSSVNGHGCQDGLRLIPKLRAATGTGPAAPDIIIGGKLGITGRVHIDRTNALLQAGFDAVFEGGTLDDLAAYVAALHARRSAAAAPLAVRSQRSAERGPTTVRAATRALVRTRQPRTAP
ncbi:cobalamin B12-binding domain-containing protein [Micromonospora sp. NPDC049048]|uniref:cobalamin B12-binding domain-containing protein n=1 Tax=Micromonospora sp. NPDC049048 TaxID=3364263 RepID=UPI003719A534